MGSKSRIEERYIVRDSELPKFVTSLQGISRQEVHPTNRNETIYFDSADHELPFEVSVKARRYTSSPAPQSFVLEPGEKWIFELKKEVRSGDHVLRQKQRSEFTLAEIAAMFMAQSTFEGAQLSSPLVPCVADSYERAHYIVGEGFRVTIDRQPTYYYFSSPSRGVQIGHEDYSRVELKITNTDSSATVTRVAELLAAVGAIPTISKKDMALNMLGAHLRRETGSKVPPSDTEIEAKLSIPGTHQYVFSLMKQDFAAGRIAGYRLQQAFPYTQVTGKLNTYILTDKEGYLRVGTKGIEKVITVKENPEIVDDGLGLGCILKRSEIKMPYAPVQGSSGEVTMYRKRKYFLVVSERTGNEYCILIDRCMHQDKSLFQVEIEEIMLRPTKAQEAEAIRELADITKQLLERYSVLKPTTLTKQEWLMGVAEAAQK